MFAEIEGDLLQTPIPTQNVICVVCPPSPRYTNNDSCSVGDFRRLGRSRPHFIFDTLAERIELFFSCQSPFVMFLMFFFGFETGTL